MRMSSALTRLLLASMMIAVLLLASCSTGPSSPASSSPSPADSKPYGSLTVAADIGSGAIDTKDGTPRTYMTTGFPIFDLLIEPDPNGTPSPGIAERWEIAKDGLSQTFYLRKGVKFHDGSDLTGADVKFSLERILAPAARHPDGTSWRAQIASLELKDDFTLVMNLKVPQFELLQGFNNYGGSTAIVPKKYIEAKGDDYFAKNPVGSGPFKVLKYEPQSRIELEAIDSHWKGAPKFKNVTVLTVNEEATKVAMLKTGELDMAAISSDSVSGLKSAGLRIVDWDGGQQAWQFVFYDLNNPKDYALSDVRVRKALSLGINRQEMATNLFGGYAKPSAVFRVPPTAYFYDSNVLKPDPYDPEGAKKLMAEAGYASGFPMKLWEMGGGGPMSTINTALAGYWRKIGVNLELVPRTYDTSLFIPTQKPEVWGTAWGNISAGGLFNFEGMPSHHSKKSSAKNNVNPRLDELIDKVPLTVDPNEKKKMALEAALLVKNDYASISILDLRALVAIGSKVGGFTPINGMGALAPAYQTTTHAK